MTAADLTGGRCDVGAGLRSGVDGAIRGARDRVDQAKRALGERGPPWWNDGSPDPNRHLVRNTVHADWYAHLPHDADADTAQDW